MRVNFGYQKDFKKKYRIGTERATGFSRFRRDFVAIDVMSSRAVAAVTRIEKMQMDWTGYVDYVKREVRTLGLFSGRINVVDFYGAFEDDDYVYIVTELCEGGSLLDRMKAKGYFPERDAARIVREMLKIISLWQTWELFDDGVQPEDFLFKSSREESTLKAGFRLPASAYSELGGRFRDIWPGTVDYMAPEVLKREFAGPKSYIWSIGVITYMLLCGVRPFVADTRDGIRDKVLENNPSFETGRWLSITSDAKDFVKKLLVTDRMERLTPHQALAHQWFRLPTNIQTYPL